MDQSHGGVSCCRAGKWRSDIDHRWVGLRHGGGDPCRWAGQRFNSIPCRWASQRHDGVNRYQEEGSSHEREASQRAGGIDSGNEDDTMKALVLFWIIDKT